MEKVSDTLNIPAIGVGTVPLPQIYPHLLQKKNPFLYWTGYSINMLYQFRQGCKLATSITDALRMGYRLIDTSRAYGVEKWIGKAIRRAAIPREEIFITSRVSNQEQYSDTVEKAVLSSLKLLQTDYIDLYMLHWPVPGCFTKSWKVLEKFHAQGVIKHLGVANFHQHHLEKLQESASVLPSVNQIEIHPLFSQKELIAYCHERGIIVEAYTPLGRFDKRIKQNETLNLLAEKYNKSISQIILRWHIQNSVIPVPRSSRYKGLQENIDIFDFMLTDNEMQAIDNINQNLRLRFDPDTADMRKL